MLMISKLMDLTTSMTLRVADADRPVPAISTVTEYLPVLGGALTVSLATPGAVSLDAVGVNYGGVLQY